MQYIRLNIAYHQNPEALVDSLPLCNSSCVYGRQKITSRNPSNIKFYRHRQAEGLIVRARELRPDDGAPYRALPYMGIFALSGSRRTYATDERSQLWSLPNSTRQREEGSRASVAVNVVAGWRSLSPGCCWRCERLRLVPPRDSRGHTLGTLGLIPTLPPPC